MKTIRILLIGMAVAFFAMAQTTGTITITGSIPEHESMTTTSDGTLGSTFDFSVLTPATGGTLSTQSVQVRLRSNKAYTLTAQSTALTVNTSTGADGGDDITAADIGFGITAIANSGTNIASGQSNTIVSSPATFNYTSGYPTVTNGLTPFTATHGTLSTLASSTQILSGSRISKRGNISTSNNFVLVTLGAAVLPEYFTPSTSFTATVTLTLATP